MGLKPPHFRGNIGKTNATPYILRFRMDCHRLLQIGYDRVKSTGTDYSQTEEDRITQLIVEEIKSYLRGLDVPVWTKRYFVRDQIKQPLPGYPPKKRPIVDIEMESNATGRPLYHFEAKRLCRNSHPVSDYIGNDGLECFLSGRYAADFNEGGMVGYVQSDCPNCWSGKIAEKLKDSPHCVEAWHAENISGGPTYVYMTRHERVRPLSYVTILHSLMDFT